MTGSATRKSRLRDDGAQQKNGYFLAGKLPALRAGSFNSKSCKVLAHWERLAFSLLNG